MTGKAVAAAQWDGTNEGKIVQLGARVNIVIPAGNLMLWSGGDWVDVPVGWWVAIDADDNATVVEYWEQVP